MCFQHIPLPPPQHRIPLPRTDIVRAGYEPHKREDERRREGEEEEKRKRKKEEGREEGREEGVGGAMLVMCFQHIFLLPPQYRVCEE